MRDPAEQLLGSLDDHTAFAREVASAEDRLRIVAESDRRRRHVRTVRKAAHARNRPRPGLAWVILVAVLLLLLAATRAAAAPGAAEDEWFHGMREETVVEPEDRDETAADSDDDAWFDTDLVTVDDELALQDFATSFTSHVLDAGDLRDRPQRMSPWGRVDVSIAWRRTWEVSPYRRDDALWLTATWRR
jgi:hypothetical protein